MKVESADPDASMPEWERRLYAGADWLDARLGIRFWLLAVLVVASFFVGTPHVLVHYQCYGRCGQNATELNCQYIGIRGWKLAEPAQGKCARVKLL
ncbi:MAG: hypothetical protein C0511_15510 [Hyphomicrobium sp.]|nr:hypothetical protein [Hyphomicrobium sp.]